MKRVLLLFVIVITMVGAAGCQTNEDLLLQEFKDSAESVSSYADTFENAHSLLNSASPDEGVSDKLDQTNWINGQSTEVLNDQAQIDASLEGLSLLQKTQNGNESWEEKKRLGVINQSIEIYLNAKYNKPQVPESNWVTGVSSEITTNEDYLDAVNEQENLDYASQEGQDRFITIEIAIEKYFNFDKESEDYKTPHEKLLLILDSKGITFKDKT